MNGIRLAIIDRRAVLCASLCAFFEKEPDFEVVWTATSPLEAVQQITNTRADAVLIDSDGCDANLSDELIHRLTTGVAAARVFLLLDRSSELSGVGSPASLISGCFLKTDSPASILNAIRAAVGTNRKEARLAGSALRVDCGCAESDGPKQRPLRLTSRQIEIITHLADGASSKEIARRLHLSVKSVSSHSYRIMKRLNLHDRVALVRFAIREGLVSP